jgi:hypothetical protein
MQFSPSTCYFSLRTKCFPRNFVMKYPHSALDLYFNLFKGSNVVYKSIPCFAYYYKISEALNMFPLLTTRYITVDVCLKMTSVLWCLIYCRVSVLSTGDIYMSIPACCCVDRFSEDSCSLGSDPQFLSLLKSYIFWDITPCSALKVNLCFGGTYRLHLQGQRISKTTNWREIMWQVEPQNVGWLFNRLQGVISQEIELFITTAVRTSNPIFLCCFHFVVSSKCWHSYTKLHGISSYNTAVNINGSKKFTSYKWKITSNS